VLVLVDELLPFDCCRNGIFAAIYRAIAAFTEQSKMTTVSTH
jgi:hypothetical protein